MTTTAAIIAAGEARAALVATMPRTQLIRGVDMTDITWGPERKHDGSDKCPDDARDVPCMIIYAPGDTCGDKGIFPGSAWLWEGVIAYRLPIPAADPVRDALVAAFEDTLTHLIVLACMVETNTLPPSLAGFQSHIDKARAALALAKGGRS